MLLAKVSDHSDSIFLSFPRECGNAIIGMPAADYKSWKENAEFNEISDYMATRNFLPITVVVRAKIDNFVSPTSSMEETRIRYMA